MLIHPFLKLTWWFSRCSVPSSCRARTRKLLPTADSRIYVGGITSRTPTPSSSIAPACNAWGVPHTHFLCQIEGRWYAEAARQDGSSGQASDSSSPCAVVECDERYDFAAKVVSYLYIHDFISVLFTQDPLIHFPIFSFCCIISIPLMRSGFAVLGRYIFFDMLTLETLSLHISPLYIPCSTLLHIFALSNKRYVHANNWLALGRVHCRDLNGNS